MNHNLIISIYENNNLLSKNILDGILKDNILIFHIDNDTIRINLKDFSFIKENTESIFKLTRHRCELQIKKINQNIILNTEKLLYNYDNNIVDLEYKLESQEYPIKINIEIGSVKNEI